MNMDMNEPIIDLEVLNDMFAVEGWTWKVHDGDAWLEREDSAGTRWTVGMHNGMLLANILPGGICSCSPDVAIAVCCAHLGLPPPWRTVARIVDELEDLAVVGEYEDEYLVYRGSAIAFETAVEIAKGNQ